MVKESQSGWLNRPSKWQEGGGGTGCHRAVLEPFAVLLVIIDSLSIVVIS